MFLSHHFLLLPSGSGAGFEPSISLSVDERSTTVLPHLAKSIYRLPKTADCVFISSVKSSLHILFLQLSAISTLNVCGFQLWA
jgi:hypothetical protein